MKQWQQEREIEEIIRSIKEQQQRSLTYELLLLLIVVRKRKETCRQVARDRKIFEKFPSNIRQSNRMG
jgi:hypothetical protein